jgi:hypothetical protein
VFLCLQEHRQPAPWDITDAAKPEDAHHASKSRTEPEVPAGKWGSRGPGCTAEQGLAGKSLPVLAVERCDSPASPSGVMTLCRALMQQR